MFSYKRYSSEPSSKSFKPEVKIIHDTGVGLFNDVNEAIPRYIHVPDEASLKLLRRIDECEALPKYVDITEPGDWKYDKETKHFIKVK